MRTIVLVMMTLLAGCGGEPAATTGAAGTAGAAPASALPRPPLPPGVVEVAVTEKGFEPDHIPAKKGELLTMLVTRKTDKTCATEIVMKDPPLNVALPLNVPVEVKVTPTHEGELLFTCAMNMIGGYIVVH
jgi:hypothetical protein